MARRRDSPTGLQDYFTARQRILSLQQQVLSGVLPHRGERGANDEERLKAFLQEILPRRCAIGTGFLVSSNPTLPRSKQTDIVIYDESRNPKLFSELAASIFPVETVYGGIEVKAVLSRAGLRSALTAIQLIRELGANKWYLDPEDWSEVKSTLRPRTYIFAYSSNTWTSLDALTRATGELMEEVKNSFFHGLVIMDKNWFIYPKVKVGKAKREFRGFESDALMRFTDKLLVDLLRFGMRRMAVSRYMEAAFINDVETQLEREQESANPIPGRKRK